MIAANGEDVITIGVEEFTFSVSGKRFQLPAVVANITTDVKLGLDFMQKYNCDISMKECTVTTEEVVIKCFMKGKMGCYRITARETITIPSEHEVVIPGKVADRGILFENVGIIEPSEKLMENKNVMSGRVLTKAHENVPIRLMNPSNEPVVIRKGTEIGTFEPVVDVTVDNREHMAQGNSNVLPEQLQTLLDKSSEHLNRTQKRQLRSTLTNYKDVFALNDDDMGYTDIVRHEIKTNGSNPVKERVRRLPHHMAEEADKQVDDMLKRGVIEKSISSWAAGIVLIRKKDGSLRFCVDYRGLNNATENDAYPLPKIDECLDSLSGAKWF